MQHGIVLDGRAQFVRHCAAGSASETRQGNFRALNAPPGVQQVPVQQASPKSAMIPWLGWMEHCPHCSYSKWGEAGDGAIFDRSLPTKKLPRRARSSPASAGGPMVVVCILVGIIGMLISAPILWWRYGPLVAFLGVPFGASLLVLALLLLLALRSYNRSHDER
jgi:hypothetical protein